jgi:hypothetical protein
VNHPTAWIEALTRRPLGEDDQADAQAESALDAVVPLILRTEAATMEDSLGHASAQVTEYDQGWYAGVKWHAKRLREDAGAREMEPDIVGAAGVGEHSE